jgi:hypothetical protein
MGDGCGVSRILASGVSRKWNSGSVTEMGGVAPLSRGVERRKGVGSCSAELAFFFGHAFLRLTGAGNENVVSHLTTRHFSSRVAITRLKAIAVALSVKIAQACLSYKAIRPF